LSHPADSGAPAASDERSLAAGPSGPTVLHDHYLVQKIQHFNRQRIPERWCTPTGAARTALFEVTEPRHAVKRRPIALQRELVQAPPHDGLRVGGQASPRT
jgi:catalase